MKRRGSYLGGSTVVRPGSDWYSKNDDPTLEDYKPNFHEIVEEFISEEIIPNLDAKTIITEGINSSSGSLPAADLINASSDLIGHNSRKHNPKLYIPAEEGRQFAKRRADSPFKKPKRKPLIEYK